MNTENNKIWETLHSKEHLMKGKRAALNLVLKLGEIVKQVAHDKWLNQISHCIFCLPLQC